MAEVLYPVAEVAKLWRCSKDYVYAQISAGRLVATSLPGGKAKTRVSESALAEFIERYSRGGLRSIPTPWRRRDGAA